MVCSAIYNNASCEIRTFVSFFQAKNMCAAETLRELRVRTVYGQSVMSEGTVRQ
jgi:hypothetical protein